MTNIEKIRQEIERLREANKRQYLSSNGGMSWQRMCGEEDCLVELLAFIDSMPKDPDKSLEEAADEYEKGYFDDCSAAKRAAYHGFIAGGSWQKKQMLKGAVEKIVGQEETILAGNPIWGKAITLNETDLKDTEYGDKVRIIIVKEEK